MANQSVTVIITLVIIANLIGFSFPKRKLLEPQEAEIERRLKKLNKHALKTIHSTDGDIIDCVNIMEQKNNTIQKAPSSYPTLHSKGREEGSRSPPLRQIWDKSGESCPQGTVSIRRTTKEDLLRLDELTEHKRRLERINAYETQISEVFMYACGDDSCDNEYIGTSAVMNVWKPRVQGSDTTSAKIWITSLGHEPLETIEVGWQVSFSRYNDDLPHLFIYSTKNPYAPGCLNSQCTNFHQLDPNMVVGRALDLSQVRGRQSELAITIYRNATTSRWWLVVNDRTIGYWDPFKTLNTATRVYYGGEVLTAAPRGGAHTATQMGNGLYPIPSYTQDAHFRNIKLLDAAMVGHEPQHFTAIVSRHECYNLMTLMTNRNDNLGTHFYYGGPGLSHFCPTM